MPSGSLITCAQWQYHCSLRNYKTDTPSGYVKNAPGDSIIIVLEIYTYTPSGYLNTAEIEKYIHTPSGHINTVATNLTYMLSDNLNICAINKYTNTLRDDNLTVATWETSTSISYPDTV